MSSLNSGKVVIFYMSAGYVTVPIVMIRLNYAYKFGKGVAEEMMRFVELFLSTLGDNSIKHETLSACGEMECAFGDTCMLTYPFGSIHDEELLGKVKTGLTLYKKQAITKQQFDKIYNNLLKRMLCSLEDDYYKETMRRSNEK